MLSMTLFDPLIQNFKESAKHKQAYFSHSLQVSLRLVSASETSQPSGHLVPFSLPLNLPCQQREEEKIK